MSTQKNYQFSTQTLRRTMELNLTTQSLRIELGLLYDSSTTLYYYNHGYSSHDSLTTMTVIQLLCMTSSTFSSYCIITLSFSHNV